MPLKTCDKCNEKVGVRTKVCPSCGMRFVKAFNPKKAATEDVDWTKLVKGDTIKSLQGYGPRRVLNGVLEYMGHYGIFKVLSLDLQGIHVYGEEGHAYLYMGEDKVSGTGTMMCAHKVKKINEPAR